ncbi:MAG: hypothetical protein WDA02_03095 [Saccharofermentanales bacterium]
MKTRLRLHNFLLNNNYLFNCESYKIYSGSDKFFYKDGLIINLFNDRSVTIKDLNSNRKYHFDKLDSNYLISNFIKVIEKTH